MKIKTRRGPKIDPCGTPHWITLRFESTLSIDTYCSLFVRNELNQSRAIPGTPQVFIFDSRISWLTQSNALRNSRNKKNTIFPESIWLSKYCKKCKMAWVVVGQWINMWKLYLFNEYTLFANLYVLSTWVPQMVYMMSPYIFYDKMWLVGD